MNGGEDSDKRKKHVNVRIRQMEIDDLATVFHLGEQLFTAREVPSLYRIWEEYEVISLFQGDPEYCLVAEVDEQIIGFVLATTISKSRSPWKYGHLVWLGVKQNFQGHGIGAKLFNHFRDLMLENGVRMLLVDTESENLPALRFFQKMGFDNPQQHIHLSLNLAKRRRHSRKEK